MSASSPGSRFNCTSASYKGRYCGTIGDVGCYSLQFNKIITAGEGGMVVTNDEEIFKRVCMYQDPIGALKRGIPSEELRYGINFRLAELLGAVALVQLKRLPWPLAARWSSSLPS